jgi:protein involved in polysaccharide export with SLBB domain
MKKNFLRIITLVLFGIFFTINAIAQTNFATIKVDELSDAQILQIMKQAEVVGATTIVQLEQMAASKGMKPEEVQKFKLRAEKLKGQGGTVQAASKPGTTGRENSETTEGGDLNNRTKQTSTGIPIFGSELFKNGNITFEPNLRIATPKGYIIGPDDKLIIDLTGDNEVNYNLGVSTEGIINLPYVGRIAVGGLTIEQASAKIRTAMRGTYPALNSGRTTLAINLGNIRSIKIIITGQAVKTGTFTVSSLSSVYNALSASGGPSQNGSFRNIQLIRNNKIVAVIDVYDFILKGIKKNDVRLEDQDVINIPVYNKRVEVSGEVKQNALYELSNNETLQDAIDFAGGYTNVAYTAKIKTFQNTDRERKIIDVPKAEFSTYIPKNGDKFVVEAILDRFANKVEIFGAVFRPGVYELEKGLTLKGLIQKTDGLTEDVFLNRAYINRLNPDQTQSLISFDLGKLMAGTIPDISLNREDKVTINSIFELREEYTVTIQGEVRAPGVFQYADNLKLEDVIQMAGGLREGATPDRIEVSRRIKNTDINSLTARTAELFVLSVDKDLRILDQTFELKPFDIISIRNSEGYSIQKQVRIEGEIMYPGLYTITSKNYRISDLVKRAGGLTTSAYVQGASLKRPGAQRVNPADKNAINNQEEESKKFLNLERVQETTDKAAEASKVNLQLVQSDLVGINLEKILERPLSKQDLILEEGDIIRIPKQLQTVKVTGEVLNPNSIVFMPNKTLRQYISGAGGFTTTALRTGVYVKYANGSAEAARKFLFFNNYPKIKPGAEILVPKKPERERLNAQSWIGISTGLATLAAIILTLIK